MNITKPHYYDEFHCIAGACPETCCADWEVVIDADSKAFYESVPGELGKQLRDAMIELDGETCFGLKDGKCRLLRPDGLCPIQAELGEEHLCKICGNYPRFTTEIGLRREMGVSLSCPEAARLILTAKEPLRLVRETTAEPMASLHELSPERILATEKLREAALAIAQDRSLPFSRRCAAVARLCGPMGKEPRDSRLNCALSEGIEAASVPSEPARGGTAHFLSALEAALSTLEPLQPERMKKIRGAVRAIPEKLPWESLCPEYPELWEQLLCYGINKYFPRTVFDKKIQSAAVFALFLPLLLRGLMAQAESREIGTLLRCAWSLSRELEHSEDNMAALWAAFSRRPFRPEAVSAFFEAI